MPVVNPISPGTEIPYEIMNDIFPILLRIAERIEKDQTIDCSADYKKNIEGGTNNEN